MSPSSLSPGPAKIETQAKPKEPRGAAAFLGAIGRSTPAMLVLSGIGFLVLWQIVSMNVSPVILPAPAAVFVAFIALTASGELVYATLATIWPFAIGLVLGFIVGTSVGLLLGIFRPAARVLDPYIFVGWSIPNIAWLPLFIAWFGVGNLTLVIFVFISAVFPQLLTVEAGAKEADSFLVEVARSLGGSKREILYNVVLPSSLPYIMAGLRIAVGRALVGIIVGQLLIVATGIGYMFQFYGETLSLAKYFAPLIVIAALAILLNRGVNWAERYFIPWKIRAFT
ncbi:MAG TPA: ABC transporter permease [Stellaceae bacterium]|jgi:NitT/TauT family transport system permease protein|nr:ABC transporter permease [Stellaceae bacterium]